MPLYGNSQMILFKSTKVLWETLTKNAKCIAPSITKEEQCKLLSLNHNEKNIYTNV